MPKPPALEPLAQPDTHWALWHCCGVAAGCQAGFQQVPVGTCPTPGCSEVPRSSSTRLGRVAATDTCQHSWQLIPLPCQDSSSLGARSHPASVEDSTSCSAGSPPGKMGLARSRKDPPSLLPCREGAVRRAPEQGPELSAADGSQHARRPAARGAPAAPRGWRAASPKEVVNSQAPAQDKHL